MSPRLALPGSAPSACIVALLGPLVAIGAPACGQAPPTMGTGGMVGTGGAPPATGGGGPSSGGQGPATGGSTSGGAPGTGGVGTGGGASGGAGSGGDVGSGGDAGLSLVLPIEVSASNYVLEFGTYKFAVDPTQGARITEFSLGDTNLITPVMLTSDSAALTGGSTFWTSPQADWDWPPIDAIDRSAYTATVSGNTIELLGGAATVDTATVHIEKAFTPDLAAEAIDLVYEIHNDGSAAASFAPWEVSRLGRGGLTFWPGARAPDAGARWDFEPTLVEGVYWWDDSASALGDHKVSSDGEQGWVAHVDGELLFIKAWTPVAATDIALDHGEVELYLGEGFIELEVQGPEAEIPAAGSSSFTVRWYVRALPVGTDVSVGSAALLAAVDAVLP